MTKIDIPFAELYATNSRNGIYKPKDFHGRGTKIVNMGELFGYDFIGDQPMERVELTPDEMQKAILADGDLLFGRRSLVEAGAGKCSIVVDPIEPLTFESSIIRVRPDKEKINPKYLFYYFKSPRGRGRISAIVSGTNVKGIRSSDLAKVLITAPERSTQDHVCEFLAVFDDLISNNRRRIELLEQSARLLFTEWFVRLRYPGHEHDKIVDGVPERWERRRIEELAETIGGGTPSTTVPNYWDGGDITWFVPTDITNNDCLVLLQSERKISEAGLKNSSARILPRDSILMTSRASVGFFGIYEEGDCCTNQGFISIAPRLPFSRMYMLFDLMRRKEEIVGKAGGTTYKEINKTTFRNLLMLMPPEQVRREFDDLCGQLIRQVRTLKRQMTRAANARDLLLPKLMDGRLSV